MKIIKAKIIDPIGLHARPASKIVNEASKYKSDIKIILDGRAANAKSIINLMSLGIKHNNKIEIEVRGLDEEEALKGIERVLIENKLVQ